MAELTFDFNIGILLRAKYPAKKRAARAVKIVRELVRRYARLKDYEIKVRPELNELLWVRGTSNPPGKIRVRVVIDEDEKVATIWPA
ncbi:MAG: 60S ribosomal protein L31 [Candidatus Korarchaeum sp.]|nr:60S ribosomal protein L31 [Candidatus Korarchaeum sp.]MDW8035223.1 50S ribosomal protein L31e [Candidatus Korarchaeum sp.]